MEVFREDKINTECRLIATIGMFDGVHLGHQTLLAGLRDEAKRNGLKSAVITFTTHPQKVLRPDGGLRMVMTLDDRLKYLDEMGVDVVILMDFTTELSKLSSRDFISLLNIRYGVDILMVGFNHHFGHGKDEYFEDYVAHGLEVGVKVLKAKEYQGEYSPVSSSLIRKVLEEGKVDLAMAYLTRPFELSGIVVHGFKNGRKIGYPTANIDVIPELIMPHKGVYAVKVELENGEIYGGMANIGVRPTVIKGGNQTFEVNLFDFDGDLYGQRLKVWFVKFMRSEMKMGSLDELKNRLAMDKVSCIETLGTYKLKNK